MKTIVIKNSFIQTSLAIVTPLKLFIVCLLAGIPNMKPIKLPNYRHYHEKQTIRWLRGKGVNLTFSWGRSANCERPTRNWMTWKGYARIPSGGQVC